jgi:A/G-specific adenine glycosylase
VRCTLARVTDPAAIARPILAWYDENARDLPWRRTRDPYRIWVSEIMLQQTRVDTVLPYYDRFLERFPTVHDLAAASDEAVRASWSGLGFYRRASNLHRAAKIVSEVNGLPTTVDELMELPGIGRYTAGAILSAAHNAKVPILDGNVIRVLSRVFRVTGAPDKAAVKRVLWALAQDVLPDDRPGDFNQAQMDLGATVCSPVAPRCDECPLASVCTTGPAGDAEAFPEPTRRQKVRFVTRVALRVDAPDGRFLLRQRPSSGLLQSLWTLPAVVLDGRQVDTVRRLAESLGCTSPPRKGGTAEHRFSHRHWTTHVYRVRGTGRESIRDGRAERWVFSADLADLGVPTAARREIAVVDGDR